MGYFQRFKDEVGLIAEIGQNHQGDARIANNLIKEADAAGFGFAKFQKRNLDHEYTKSFGNAPYTGENSFGRTYAEHREHLELTYADLKMLKARANEFNDWPIELIVTPCHQSCVGPMLEVFNPPFWKVASRDIDNGPLLAELNLTRRPVVISTGMADAWEIERALTATAECEHLLMHCTSVYPCTPLAAQLMQIPRLEKAFGCMVGWSDHTSGVALAPAAVTLGARLLEKHITFSRAAKGSDHAGSLEPPGMAAYVSHVRAAELATRSKTMIPHPDTVPAQNKLRRSLVATRELPRGHLITEADLELRSPGTGVAWWDRHALIGKRLARSVKEGEMIGVECVAIPAKASTDEIN